SAGHEENPVEQDLPDGCGNMRTKLYSNGAQHEQPEDHHQRQIEAAETGGIKLRESKVESASGGNQPDFVAIPNRSDGAKDHGTFGVTLGGNQIDNAGAQVKAVEHDIGGNHQGYNHEPERFHAKNPQE